MIEYIDRTQPLRGSETQLLISYIKPHKAVRSCTIANWLKKLLTKAGIDTEIFKPHSIRGASTSKAMKYGVSVKQILQAANWKSENTFERFYHRQVTENTGGGTAFTEGVLKLI